MEQTERNRDRRSHRDRIPCAREFWNVEFSKAALRGLSQRQRSEGVQRKRLRNPEVVVHASHPLVVLGTLHTWEVEVGGSGVQA